MVDDTAEVIPQWVLCTALPSEAAPLRKRLRRHGARLRSHSAWPGSVCARWHGEAVVLGTLGMRAARLREFDEFLAQWPPQRGMLLLGFAGGLVPTWRPGEIALATAVVDARANEGTEGTWHVPASAHALAQVAAARAGVSVKAARLLTHTHVITDPDIKATLAQRSGCDLVEMEAAPFVALAERHQLDWLCVRSVFDTAVERLPALERLAQARGLNVLRELAILASTQPRSFASLPRLARRSAACGRKLVEFADAFFAAVAENTLGRTQPEQSSDHD